MRVPTTTPEAQSKMQKGKKKMARGRKRKMT
jgi:hypothetical protein